jgi:hypothetical protein
VIYGTVDTVPQLGEKVELHSARMVLQWDSACGGLFGLAESGPVGDTRLSGTVILVRVVAQQIIRVSPKAKKKLEDWNVYRG